MSGTPNSNAKIFINNQAASAFVPISTSPTYTFTTTFTTTGAFSGVYQGVNGRVWPHIVVGDLGDVEEIIVVPEPAQIPDYPPAETPIVTEPENVPVPV